VAIAWSHWGIHVLSWGANTKNMLYIYRSFTCSKLWEQPIKAKDCKYDETWNNKETWWCLPVEHLHLIIGGDPIHHILDNPPLDRKAERFSLPPKCLPLKSRHEIMKMCECIIKKTVWPFSQVEGDAIFIIKIQNSLAG
jgi:hypothetical protein